MTGAPEAASAATCARNLALADRSAACTSGNPPPMTGGALPGQLRVHQRVERHHPGSRGAQQFGVLGVAESEGRAARHRDAARPRREGPFGINTWSGSAAASGEREYGLQVQQPATIAASASTAARRLPPGSGAGTSPRWRDGTSSWRGAESPSTGMLARLRRRGQPRVVRRPTWLRITPPSRTGVKGREAVRRRPRTSRRRQCRRPGTRARRQPRDVGGRRQVPPSPRAVEKPHHAFDHRDVGRRRGSSPVGEHRHDLLFADQPRVEVAARPPGRQRVVAGVDEVRPHLVRETVRPRPRSAPISPVATKVFP